MIFESVSDLGNLRKALITFDYNGRYSSRGSWSIARGGYDLWFEICYKNTPVIHCVDGELENCCLSNDAYIKVCALIHSVYQDIPMPSEWGYRLTYLGETTRFWESGEVFDSTEYDDIYYSGQEAFDAALDHIKFSGLTRENFDIDTFELN
jgi:hypothetical protein